VLISVICGQSLSLFLSLKSNLWKSASTGHQADNHISLQNQSTYLNNI